MKTIKRILLITSMLGMASPLQAKISQELDQRLDAMITRLHQAKGFDDYKSEDFLADVKKIAVEFNKGRLNTIDSSVTALKREFIALSSELNKEDNEEFIKELKAWYGRYDFEIPHDFIRKYYVKKKIGSYRLPPSKREAQQRANFSHRIHALHEEHGQANYVTAWKFWLISPPSKERDLMRERINQALKKTEDKRVIPLLLETLKVEAKRTQDQRVKKSQCIAQVNLICKMPTEQSLDALLEINRFAIQNDLNGEDYYKSVTRYITRRLASRRAYADQLIDPKMKATIEHQGYNEKPEDIPLVDDLWKKYKPILEMRLGTKKNAMPKADIDLIQSALQITAEK